MTEPLWPHQVAAADHICRILEWSPGAALFADMRTGKTRMAIEVLQRRKARKVLVLGPKHAIKHVWPNEVLAFGPYAAKVLGGRIAERTQIVRNLSDATFPFIMATNFESLAYRTKADREAHRQAGPLERALLKVPWDAIVIDESHKLSSPSGRTALAVRRLAQEIPIRLALTGTPVSMSAGPLGIWMQYRILNPRIYQPTSGQFKDVYTESCRWGDHDGVRIGAGGALMPWRYRAMHDLRARMGLIAYRVKAADVLDLPGESDRIVEFKLEPRATKFYRDLIDKFVAEYEETRAVTRNVLVRLLRLQQLTGGSVRMDDDSVQEVSGAKLSALLDLIDEIQAEPIVVMCRFHTDIDPAAAALAKRKRKVFELSGRKDDLEAWNESENGVLLVQVQAGGVGIDLTHSRVCIWYSLGYSLTDYDQARARLRGSRQKHAVTHWHLVARHTVDVEVRRALAGRQNLVDETIMGIAGQVWHDKKKTGPVGATA